MAPCARGLIAQASITRMPAYVVQVRSIQGVSPPLVTRLRRRKHPSERNQMIALSDRFDRVGLCYRSLYMAIIHLE